MRHIKSNEDFVDFIKGVDIAVLDFYAQWCGPCKKIAPKLDALANEFRHVAFAKVDVVDADYEFVNRFYVTALPTFVFIRRGKIVDRVEGADINSVKFKLENMLLL